MDPLSDVLSLLKLRTSVYGGFHAGGAWCLEFGPHEGAKFHAAVSGECWLAVEGISEPFHVQAGDCLLLPRGRAFRVASDLTLPPTDPSELLSGANGGITLNGGGDFFSVSGYFHLVGNQASILLGLLPPVVHIRRDSDKDLLRWCLELLRQELQKPQPGGTLVAQHVASLLLLQVLRLYLAQANATDVGWLFALTDKQMSAALQAMHDDPARAWTLQSLATCVGSSISRYRGHLRDDLPHALAHADGRRSTRHLQRASCGYRGISWLQLGKFLQYCLSTSRWRFAPAVWSFNTLQPSTGWYSHDELTLFRRRTARPG